MPRHRWSPVLRGTFCVSETMLGPRASAQRHGELVPAARRRAGSRRGWRGQALVLALVLMFAGSLGLMFMFSTGQTAATKQRLTNAADAAAYGAAIWRARVLNYDAYSNRAIILQEVAIAQAVTLTSWSKYFETFVQNIADVVSALVPYLAPLMQEIAQIVGYAQDAAEEAATLEVWLRGADEVGFKNLLAASQEILQLSIGTFGLGAVANEVARANDPRFFAFVLPDQDLFNRFTRRYESDADRRRLQQLVIRSLDEFVTGRGADFGDPFMCLRKRGGTAMAPGLERWEAADTLSLHAGEFRRPRELCPMSEQTAFGYGAAQASTSGEDSIESNPGDVELNRMALQEAESDLVTLDGYSGISRVRDLDYDSLDNPRFPTSPVAVLARVGQGDVRTAATIGVGAGRLRLAENLAGGRLWSLAAADVYFRRPPNAPARVEYASLYSPYWQVRLRAPTLAQRAIAEAYLGL